jgi:hypothetical protein
VKSASHADLIPVALLSRAQRIIVFLGVDGVAKKVLGMAKRLQMYYAPYQWLGTEGSLGETTTHLSHWQCCPAPLRRLE